MRKQLNVDISYKLTVDEHIPEEISPELLEAFNVFFSQGIKETMNEPPYKVKDIQVVCSVRDISDEEYIEQNLTNINA